MKYIPLVVGIIIALYILIDVFIYSQPCTNLQDLPLKDLPAMKSVIKVLKIKIGNRLCDAMIIGGDFFIPIRQVPRSAVKWVVVKGKP